MLLYMHKWSDSMIFNIMEFIEKWRDARWESRLQALHKKREDQANQAINDVKKAKDIPEADQLAYLAEYDIREVFSFEKEEQLRQKLADVLCAKVKELIDPVKTCTNLDEMKNYRNLIRRTKKRCSSYTLNQVIDEQLEKAKRINADMIIAKMEESTDYAEIHNLYDIIDLYLSDKVPHVDIEDYIMIGPEHFVVNLGPDREEINKKLNRCVNEKVDLFLTIIEKHEGNYFDSSIHSLMYRMECILEDEEKDKYYNTLLKIINNALSQIKENPEYSWLVRFTINELKWRFSEQEEKEIELNIHQTLKNAITELIQRINNESDLLEINRLASKAEESMSNLSAEERKELEESLKNAINGKINLLPTGNLCDDIEEIYKNIIILCDSGNLAIGCPSSYSLRDVIHCQLDKAFDDNWIFEKMQESTNIDEIIKLYCIVEMYISRNINTYRWCTENLNFKEKEVNKKLNECLNFKVDIILEEIKKRENLDSLDSLLYRLKDNLDAEGKTKFDEILMEKIYNLINRIKESNDNRSTILYNFGIEYKVNRIKLYISYELIEEVESNIQKILQGKEIQSEDDSISCGEKPKVLELK